MSAKTVAAQTASPGLPAALEVAGLTVGYQADLHVLHDVSLQVQVGQLCGLIGLNGAGKSTLLKAICGFLRPSAGGVRLFGEDITATAPHRVLRQGLYLVPQESSLFPYLSVADNLALVARARGTDVELAYQRFPVLRDLRRTLAGNLSGGQQKMVEFARALLARPRMLLVDEPTVGLAPLVAQEVYGWLEAFRREGISILLVDHNIPRVVHMADYIYVLNLGRIVAHGPRSQFQRDLRQQVQQWLGFVDAGSGG